MHGLFPISALAALLPAAILSWRRPRRDAVLLLLIAVAAAGPASWAVALMSGGWRTGLAPALWVSIAATALEFLALALVTREGWRLAPLVLPYLVVLGALALLVDAPADHRGGDSLLAGGGGKAAALGNLDEGGQFLESVHGAEVYVCLALPASRFPLGDCSRRPIRAGRST